MFKKFKIISRTLFDTGLVLVLSDDTIQAPEKHDIIKNSSKTKLNLKLYFVYFFDMSFSIYNTSSRHFKWFTEYCNFDKSTYRDVINNVSFLKPFSLFRY